MDIHGNPENRDVFGNSMDRDVFGNQSNADIFGNPPRDVFGNYNADMSDDANGIDGRAELDVLGNLIHGIFKLFGGW